LAKHNTLNEISFPSGNIITSSNIYHFNIDPPLGGFGVIFPEMMIFSEGLCPEENITEGNIAESPKGRVYK
jgi:hypothetical protein